MTGDRRADYVSIDPDNGRINLWENNCWAIDDGGDGDGSDDGGDGGDDGDEGGENDDKPWKGRTKDDFCLSAKQQGFLPDQQAYV